MKATIVILSFFFYGTSATFIQCPPQYVQIPVNYSVQFPDSKCPARGTKPYPITVAVPAGSTALDVLVGAVDISRDYQFSATSYGATLGFQIDKISGTSAVNGCYWSFFVDKGAGPVASNVGVSSFSICDDVSIIYRLLFFGSGK